MPDFFHDVRCHALGFVLIVAGVASAWESAPEIDDRTLPLTGRCGAGEACPTCREMRRVELERARCDPPEWDGW